MTKQRGLIMENGRILVVEDNEMDMKLVRTMLQLGEYRVLEAVDAETGIQVGSEH